MISVSTLQAKINEIRESQEVKAFTDKAEVAAKRFESTSGATLGQVPNEIRGGFESLTAATNEDLNITYEPVAAKMDATASVKVRRTIKNKTNVSNLTSITIVEEEVFLDQTIVQGSPEGLEKALREIADASDEEIEFVIQETAASPEEALAALDVLLADPASPLRDIASTVANEAQEVFSLVNEKLNNPINSANNPFKALGQELSNLLGNIAGEVSNLGTVSELGITIPIDPKINPLKGVIGTIAQDTQTFVKNLLNSQSGEKFAEALKIETSFSPNLSTVRTVLNDELQQISKKSDLTDAEVLNTLPAVQQELINNAEVATGQLVDALGNTGLRKLVTDDVMLGENVKPTDDIFKLASALNNTLWSGASTIANEYIFQYVSTFEELQGEFASIQRPVTTVVAHWTRTYIDQDWDAAQIHKNHIDMAISRAADGIIAENTVDGGLQYHYIFRRDGTIQRGRPIGLVTEDASMKDETIHIAFVAGYNCPSGTKNKEVFLSSNSITRAQWTSFEKFCEAFFKSYPGGQILSHREIDPEDTCPGFDASEWAYSRFGRQTIYKEPEGITKAFTPAEVVVTPPVEPVKPTVSVAPAPPPPPPPADRYDYYKAEVTKVGRGIRTEGANIDGIRKQIAGGAALSKFTDQLNAIETNINKYITQNNSLRTEAKNDSELSADNLSRVNAAITKVDSIGQDTLNLLNKVRQGEA